ncbi:unnamed protein product [Caenorhabditis auriculariae]|uniref:Granulins domain-containing protein n=1 Tax=Caenorhabditis auriculariae TaxID=2777116 RepID=A0A8S1HR32_9PELO|nr:unnamed protein product [Caenorhabditis auriculariae]
MKLVSSYQLVFGLLFIAEFYPVLFSAANKCYGWTDWIAYDNVDCSFSCGGCGSSLRERCCLGTDTSCCVGPNTGYISCGYDPCPPPYQPCCDGYEQKILTSQKYVCVPEISYCSCLLRYFSRFRFQAKDAVVGRTGSTSKMRSVAQVAAVVGPFHRSASAGTWIQPVAKEKRLDRQNADSHSVFSRIEVAARDLRKGF